MLLQRSRLSFLKKLGLQVQLRKILLVMLQGQKRSAKTWPGDDCIDMTCRLVGRLIAALHETAVVNVHVVKAIHMYIIVMPAPVLPDSCHVCPLPELLQQICQKP